MWTKFWDMHSGGRTKIWQKPDGTFSGDYWEGEKKKWIEKQIVYIEAPEQEAKVIFYNRFGHSPDRVTCNCCGSDYSISEDKSLRQLTAYHRGCDYAYLNKSGKEVEKSKAWIPGKGMKKGYTCGYVERQDPKHTWEKYRNLKTYLLEPDVLIICARDIKPTERLGELP